MSKPTEDAIPRPLAAHVLAGRAAEQAAADFLAAAGLEVLGRNLRVKGGEIDLLARDGEVLVFCEVRWRADARFGGALASIDARKRARMQRAARAWLACRPVLPRCRLDVLCADGAPPWRWTWLRGI